MGFLGSRPFLPFLALPPRALPSKVAFPHLPLCLPRYGPTRGHLLTWGTFLAIGLKPVYLGMETGYVEKLDLDVRWTKQTAVSGVF